jgi:uncharacterized protein (DUF2225 family)
MSATIFRRALLVATLLVPTTLVVTSVTRADSTVKAKVKCGICEHEYEGTFTASSFQSGQRLDLRPLRFPGIVSPPRVAVCPKCGFVEYREDAKYPQDELKAVREFVLSDDYKQLAKSETSYFRIAKMFERLKRPQSQIAYGYLQATWQVEHEDGKRPQAYLQASLDSYGKVISDEKAPAEQRQMARFLKGEMLRRLGKFEDAKTHFEDLGKLEASKADPYPKLIPLELDLIGKKDKGPHEIPTSKEKE